MEKLIEQAADTLLNSQLTLALTGAGVSVESGIPDFRSAGGLWEKFDPAEYATIQAFRANPEMVWEMLREMDAVVNEARPNPAHMGMGELEKMGYLHCIITQNVTTCIRPAVQAMSSSITETQARSRASRAVRHSIAKRNGMSILPGVNVKAF